MKGRRMRLIDAEELLEHACREKLDSRESVYNLIGSAQTVTSYEELERNYNKLKANFDYLRDQNNMLKGEVKALIFAVRCNGVSGAESKYYGDDE